MKSLIRLLFLTSIAVGTAAISARAEDCNKIWDDGFDACYTKYMDTIPSKQDRVGFRKCMDGVNGEMNKCMAAEMPLTM